MDGYIYLLLVWIVIVVPVLFFILFRQSRQSEEHIIFLLEHMAKFTTNFVDYLEKNADDTER